MHTEQKTWTEDNGWVSVNSEIGNIHSKNMLVFAFGGRAQLEDENKFKDIVSFYPDAHILMCSTAGEISDINVTDNSISLLAVAFESTELAFAIAKIDTNTQSYEVGASLAHQLPKDDLAHVLLFSDGLKVNGTALLDGIASGLPPEVVVTGGMAGDGATFKKTVVGLDAVPSEGTIVLVGLYGNSLRIGHGSLGGWDTFGVSRVITRSEGNKLFELDGQPALELYKEYLGEQAEGLPMTGLNFPLKLRSNNENDDTEVEVVRTLLAVDEAEQSMTFAGDMPEGSYATLMKANFERLVDGAAGAAAMSLESLETESPDFALLISCVGRKLVLKDGVEVETEAVRQILGKDVAMAGFYSYGEISPIAAREKQCRLHNQTMTITVFKEV